MQSRHLVIAALLVLAGLARTGSAQSPFEQMQKAIEKARQQMRPPAAPQKPGPAQPGQQAPASATAAPLNAKVEEKLMGPVLGGPGVSARLSMSEDGNHLAITTAKGSRQVVLLDGVEGPVFDEIPTVFAGMVQVSVQWSPTGGHSAYLGRRGGDLIAVIDGKEAGVVASSQTGMTVNGANGWTFWFNEDGSHLAYAGYSGPGSWQMVADGVKSPAYREIDFRQTFLKGKRLAYVAQTADQQWHAVIDGKPGPGYAGVQLLQVTPDGAHYAYLGQKGGSMVVVADGVETGQSYPGIGAIELAPDGRVAYVAATKVEQSGAHGGGAAMLVVAGTPRPGSCGTGASPMCMTFANWISVGLNSPQRHVAWSPDGKGVAWVQSNSPNPGVTVMVNGKPMGPTYSNATQLSWSPDGRRFAYLATSPNGFFVVIDGQELPAINDVPEFMWSPDGKRYAFQGQRTLVVDGKELPASKGGIMRESFRWSPDSKHFAYGAQVNIAGYGPVVDGEAKPFYLQGFAAMSRVQPQITFPPLLFSPDGSHLAYVGITYDATGRGNSKPGVVLDDVRYEGPSQSFMFPSFSPDSRHFATLLTTGNGWTIMLDGKVGPLYEDIVPNKVAAFRFVSDHEYRFYGIKAGQIYRVTLVI
jgi:hypothetical protein